MLRFLAERAFKDDYLEQLADERAGAERDFLLKVLAKKEAENRQCSARGWLIGATSRRP